MIYTLSAHYDSGPVVLWDIEAVDIEGAIDKSVGLIKDHNLDKDPVCGGKLMHITVRGDDGRYTQSWPTS